MRVAQNFSDDLKEGRAYQHPGFDLDTLTVWLDERFQFLLTIVYRRSLEICRGRATLRHTDAGSDQGGHCNDGQVGLIVLRQGNGTIERNIAFFTRLHHA